MCKARKPKPSTWLLWQSSVMNATTSKDPVAIHMMHRYSIDLWAGGCSS